MKSRLNWLSTLFVLLLARAWMSEASELLGEPPGSKSPVKPDLVVAKDGHGDFASVQAAVQSIPKSNRERKIILIKDGSYNEKVRIDASFVTLQGESHAGVHIQFPWARDQGSDALGQAVLNINGDDCVIENLTIENTDNVLGRHAFAVYGRGDRTVIQDADILSQGNDTLSLWRTGHQQNLKSIEGNSSPNGRYYHARLKVRGSVDFVCPRGWCFMRDSELIEVNPWASAAMWHDGWRDRDMKFVMTGCRFDGPLNFRLARHHQDAMFFFIDCSFSKNLRDAAPVRVLYPTDNNTTAEENKKKNQEYDQTNIWGERAYYFNSHREGGDFAWHKDNLTAAPGSPKRVEITAEWTFAGTWNPERADAPTIVRIDAEDSGRAVATFSEAVTVKGKPRLIFGQDQFAEFKGGSGSNKLEFSGVESLAKPTIDLNGGSIIASEAGARIRVAVTYLP